MRYTIQRPATIWLETVVEADSLEEAIELADKDFNSGDYVEMIQTWDIDFDRHWIQDENGEVRQGSSTYELVSSEGKGK